MKARRFTILHLSDAHIGHPEWIYDWNAVMNPLLLDIAEFSNGRSPDLFIFSGDLVYGEVKGQDVNEQFTQARSWLIEIHKKWGRSLGDVPILIVPGNHDVLRSAVDESQTDWLQNQKSSAAIEQAITTRSKLWTRMLERQALWWNFVKSIPNNTWTYEDSIHMTHGIISHNSKQLGVVGFNSSWSSSQNKEKGHLWFTRHQFEVGSQHIKSADFKIGVLHHPFSWFHEHEESWLQQKFESQFDLVLHGHLHNTWYFAQARNVIISAGASWGGSSVENGYSWIEIDMDREALDLSARIYQDKGKGCWVGANIPEKFDIHGKVNLPYGSRGNSKGSVATEPADTVVLEEETSLTGTHDVADSFPPEPEHQIDRRKQIDDLLEVFDPSTHLLLLLGYEGVGKTILVAQLAKSLPNLSLSIFINASPHWSSQLSNIRYDLCNQIHWILHGKQLDYAPSSDQMLASYLHRLHKSSRSKKSPAYILIDGLNQFCIPTGRHIINDVFDLFRAFTSYFNFVVSLPPEFLPEAFKQLPYRTYTAPRFDEIQTLKYLENVTSTDKGKELWLLTNGHPGALSSVRRILRREPQTTVESLPSKLPDLLEREWRAVDEGNSNQLLLLAGLAHHPKRFSIDSLTNVLKIPPPEVIYATANLPFLYSNPQTGNIGFTSEAVRKFISKKLKRLELSIKEAILQELLQTPEEAESLQEIPLYLHEVGRDEEMMAYLSPDHLEKLLQKSQSWHQAIEKADMAFHAASIQNRLKDYTRFALHRSSLVQFQSVTPGHTETQALLALGRWSEAITFAENQVTKENQLLLFASIARAAKEQNFLLPVDVIDSLRRLVDELKGTVGSEQRLEIASELVHVFPDLAIRVVETLSDKQENIDSALAGISFRALVGQRKNTAMEDSLADISSKIGDEKVRRFTSAAQVVLSSSSAAAALARIKGLSNPKDQIYLLRQWSISHPRATDALPLLEYALDLIVSTTEYVPNARVLRELAIPLPSLEKDYRVSILLSRLSDQIRILKDKGFTQDYVELQLTLAQTEAAYNEDTFENRLTALYVYVCEIEDLSVRTTCIASMCNRLRVMEVEAPTLSLTSLSADLSNDLKANFEKLLLTTADHYAAARDAILKVRSYDGNAAFGLISKINTEPRRNQLFADLLVAEFREKNPEASKIKPLLGVITDVDLLEATLERCWSTLILEKNQIDQELAELLVETARSTNDFAFRCRGFTTILVVNLRITPPLPQSALDSIYQDLHAAWEQIDDLTEKQECGFEIVSALAPLNLSIAVRYWDATKAIESGITITDEEYADTVYYSIFLAIRLFRGLIPKSLASTVDRTSLIQRISRIPSITNRVRLFSQLALSYLRHDRKSSEAANIVNDQIYPLLDHIANKSRDLYENTFIEVAPVLYVAHTPSTRMRLKTLAATRRDMALSRIGQFILTKVDPHDPFSAGEKHDYKLSFPELFEVVDLMDMMENDSLIYSCIKAISDTVSSARGKKTFSIQQQTELSTQLHKVVSDKLPNPKFIQHLGYKLVALAEISRFAGSRDEDIQLLIQDARELTNSADKVYVLGLIASSLPASRLSLARTLLNEALDLVPTITTYEDRIERYRAISSFAETIDRSIAQRALRQAMLHLPSIEDWRGRAHARRIVDAAYRIDKHLAEEIATKLDTDPARGVTSKVTTERNREEALRKQISDVSSAPSDFTEKDYAVIPKVAWVMLGEINAGKLACIKLPKYRDLIRVASKLSFQDAFQLWMFLAENLATQYENTDQAETFLRQLFDAAIINSELAQRIANVRRADATTPLATPLEEYYSGVSLVAAGAKQKALDEIEQWCSEFVEDYVLVVDPSLRQDDMSLIELIRRAVPDCHIVVLLSKANQQVKFGTNSIEDSFKSSWKQIAGALDPKGIEFVLVGASLTGDLPVNDRMLLSKRGGLWMSVTFSQLGVVSESTLRRMSTQDAEVAGIELEPFLDLKKAKLLTRPISTTRFTLY